LAAGRFEMILHRPCEAVLLACLVRSLRELGGVSSAEGRLTGALLRVIDIEVRLPVGLVFKVIGEVASRNVVPLVKRVLLWWRRFKHHVARIVHSHPFPSFFHTCPVARVSVALVVLIKVHIAAIVGAGDPGVGVGE